MQGLTETASASLHCKTPAGTLKVPAAPASETACGCSGTVPGFLNQTNLLNFQWQGVLLAVRLRQSTSCFALGCCVMCCLQWRCDDACNASEQLHVGKLWVGCLCIVRPQCMLHAWPS